jgi:hypothetical protein
VYQTNNSAAWTAVSDERVKRDLLPIEDGLEKIKSLRALTGRYVYDDENDVTARRSFLIAQDFATVFPEAVDRSNPDRLGLAYTDAIPLLLAALKEAGQRIETLETTNASLEARLTALEGGAS